MTFDKLIFALLFSIITIGATQAQTAKTIDSLEQQEQNCLDKGQHMLGCAKMFYYQMDSMLNIAYIKLRSMLDSSEKVELKKEQLKWLASRDSYFKTTYKEFKKSNPDKSPYGSAFGAQDDAMFMYDDNAKFLKERVLILLKRLNT